MAMTKKKEKAPKEMGGRTRVKVVKNKVAAPFKQTEFDIIYGEGISYEGELMALGEKIGIVAKSSGGSYTYTPMVSGKPGKAGKKSKDGEAGGETEIVEKEVPGEEIKMGRGYDATRTFLRENPKIAKDIEKTVRSRFGDIQVSSAAE